MKLRTLGLAALLLGSSSLLVSSSPLPPPAPGVFLTFMSGAQEVPPVESDGLGAALFVKRPFSDSFFYILLTARLEDIAASHIHMAEAGSNGPVVVTLFEAAEPVTQNGLLAMGEIPEEALVGPLAGEPLSALMDAMRNGRAYVNVHTVAHRPGEIRGQLKALGR